MPDPSGSARPAIMRAVSRGPPQHVELEVVVTPLLYRAAREIEEPLPGSRMRPVERVDPAAPVLARVPHDRRAPVGALQEPVGMGRRKARALGDGEGGEPQAGLEALGVDLVREPAVTVREPVV